jgi:hypothetical protein
MKSRTQSFVERELDRIEDTGQKVGRTFRSIAAFVKKFAFVIWILAGFGLLVFIWSMVRGFREKK